MNKKSSSIYSAILVIICLCSVSAGTQVITIDDVRDNIFYTDFDLEKSITLISENQQTQY